MAVFEPKVEVGACPKCGKWLDDHNGWLTRDGPYCPPKKDKR
jgi:hypothetical protein